MSAQPAGKCYGTFEIDPPADHEFPKRRRRKGGIDDLKDCDSLLNTPGRQAGAVNGYASANLKLFSQRAQIYRKLLAAARCADRKDCPNMFNKTSEHRQLQQRLATQPLYNSRLDNHSLNGKSGLYGTCRSGPAVVRRRDTSIPLVVAAGEAISHNLPGRRSTIGVLAGDMEADRT